MLHFKLLEKQKQTKPKISRRKENKNKKVRAQINEIEIKNIQRKESMKQKASSLKR
jgi:hypothetical protein